MLHQALAAALIVSGYAVSMRLASSPDEATQAVERPLAAPLSGWSTFAAIVTHNSLVALLVVAGGVLLGVITIAQLWSIGYAFGLEVAHATARGLTNERVMALTLPHALVELAAFVVVGGIGLEIAGAMGRYSWSGESWAPRAVLRSMGRLGIALALIIVAAGLEAYLTPLCAEMVR